MAERPSNRTSLWIPLVLFLIVVTAAGVLLSINRSKPVTGTVTPPATTETHQPDYAAATSWKVFTDDARAKCKGQQADCSVDYTALREYGTQTFGVMIVGYKDSEYVTDLYRYDPKSRTWVSSPRCQPENGYEAIDTFAASKKWGVPMDVLDEWITSAEKAVKRVYERRAKE